MTLLGPRRLTEYNPYHDARGRFARRGAIAPGLSPPVLAAAQLAAGERPSIAPEDVGPTLDLCAARSDNPDLTELKVEGTLKFGGDGLGIARKDMPQLPEGAQREAYFVALKQRGVKITEKQVSPQVLKPTQKEVSARVSGQILGAMRSGDYRESNRLTVSSDNFVLDGHHRWGAATARSFEVKGYTIGIDQIDMPIQSLLTDAAAWTASQGIANRGLGEAIIDWGSVFAEHLPQKHNQKAHGPGGKAAAKAAAWDETLKAMHEEVATTFPGIRPGEFDLSAMAPEVEAEVLDSLIRVGSKYPEAAAHMTQLTTGKIGAANVAATQPGTGQMVFNRDIFATRQSLDAAKAQWKQLESMGGYVKGDLDGVVTHEFGHLLLGNASGGDVQKFAMVEMLVGLAAPVSGYGGVHGGENFAEMFVAHEYPALKKSTPVSEGFVNATIAAGKSGGTWAWAGALTPFDQKPKRSDVIIPGAVVLGETFAEHLPGQHDQSTHGKGGLSTATARVAKQEGHGKAAGANTEADFFRTARGAGMAVDNRGLVRGEPGVHIVRKKGNNTSVAYYDDGGKPVGLVVLHGRKIDLVAIRPSERGKGHGTKMYDLIQDTTPINLYDSIGTSRDFTIAGKAFAEKWLAHRMTIEAAS